MMTRSCTLLYLWGLKPRTPYLYVVPYSAFGVRSPVLRTYMLYPILPLGSEAPYSVLICTRPMTPHLHPHPFKSHGKLNV